MDREIVTVNDLDSKYEQFQALLQQEKNKSAVLQKQLQSARQTISCLKQSLEEADEKKMLKTISDNCKAAKEQAEAARFAIIEESERNRKEAREARDREERRFSALQKCYKKISAVSVIALILLTLFILFSDNLNVVFTACAWVVCSVLFVVLGYFINDFVRIIKWKG